MKRAILLLSLLLLAACGPKKPADYVNPYMGNISHLLVPTYPTVHLPNSMLRVYPERADFTGDVIEGLPIVVTSHRGASAFNLSPFAGEGELLPVIPLSYDREEIHPWYYSVYLDEQQTGVRFAPSHQSALYQIDFSHASPRLIFNTRGGGLKAEGSTISGWQQLENNTRVYLWAETDVTPSSAQRLEAGTLCEDSGAEGRNACLVLSFAEQTRRIVIRYGISFISVEQARANNLLRTRAEVL